MDIIDTVIQNYLADCQDYCYSLSTVPHHTGHKMKELAGSGLRNYGSLCQQGHAVAKLMHDGSFHSGQASPCWIQFRNYLASMSWQVEGNYF